MASQPPPGYNPEVSLLSGGQGTILPVQGGGSMDAGSVPPGYNPDKSLLDTPSNTPILAIRGGGEQSGGQEEVPYAPFVLEHYEPPLEMIEIPTLPESLVRRDLITKYITASLPFLKEIQSLERAPVTFAFTDEVAPTYQKCSTEKGKRRLPLNFFEIVRKRIVLIDEPEPYIWIIPNLKGSLSHFIQYMQRIPKTPEGKIAPKHYVFFTGAFFSLTAVSDNFILYHEFLKEKLKNMDQLYYINNLNDDFVNTACSVVKGIYSSETLRSPDAQEKPLSLFFEPDIVLFTKAHIVFKNSPLPVQRENNQVKLSKIVKIPDFRFKSFLLVPSRENFDDLPSDDSDAPPEQRYFSFFFHRNILKQIKTPSPSVLTCPKDQTCAGFKGGYRLLDVGDERKIDQLGLYLISKNTDKMPFLKEAGSILPEVVKVEEKVIEKKEEEKPKEEVKPKEAEKVKEEIKVELPVSREKDIPFKAAPSAFVAKAEQKLPIDDLEYSIRIPFQKEVREDWLKGSFTEDEVKLLTTLQMTPSLLSEGFGSKGWQPKLADFLESLVLSNCFQDTKLMTDTECSNSKEFVRKIYLTLYNRMLSNLYDSLGYPKPQNFEEILGIFQGLSDLGYTRETSGMSKFDFTGDLLERFQMIHFDPIKQEYYTDFVKMSEETRKLLEGVKFYRVEDKDFDVISQSILKHMNMPVVSGGGDEEEIIDLGDPIEEEEVFDLGEPLKRGKTRRNLNRYLNRGHVRKQSRTRK